MSVNSRETVSSQWPYVSALEVTGSYKGITGHDHHTRTLVREFHKLGLRIHLHDLPEWSPAKQLSSMKDPWFDRLSNAPNARHHLYFCMPHQVSAAAARVRRINYTMFEADRISRLWIEHGRMHDLVIVPANSSKQAWIESGMAEEKIAVCPLGVDVETFSPGAKPMELAFTDGRRLSDFRYRFLNVSDATARKNLFSLLHSWICSTSSKDDAVLILKPGFFAPGLRARFFSALRVLEAEIGKKLEQAAPVFILDEILAAADMPGVYTTATHYVSVSRGEGFDMSMTEAGASGLQLIAPRHSAYLDYLNDEIAHLISAKPVKAALPEDPATEEFFAGARWWEPNRDELCDTLRTIIDGKATAKTGARQALAAMSWRKTAEDIIELLRKI